MTGQPEPLPGQTYLDDRSVRLRVVAVAAHSSGRTMAFLRDERGRERRVLAEQMQPWQLVNPVFVPRCCSDSAAAA